MGRQGKLGLGKRTSMRCSSHHLPRVALRAALLVLAAASVSAVASGQQPGIDGPSKALEGRWRIELYLDKPSAHAEPMAGQINGEIDFSSMAWWNPSDRFGRHNLNLQSFFGNSFLRPANITAFGPGDTSMVTEVSGNVRGDSVGIDFIPRVDHGGVSMWGRFWGDSAKGRWYRRGIDGEGHFVLRRISKDAVALASIPDGRPTAVAAAAPPPKPLTKAQARALARKEAAAKAKARADSIAVARAEAQKQAKAAALAKAAARDSAKAVALAEAKAKAAARDSAKAVALADAKAKAAARDSARAQATLAANAAPSTSASPARPTNAPGGALPGAMPNALASATRAGANASRSAGGVAPSPAVRVASAPAAAPAAAPTAAAGGTVASTPAASSSSGADPSGSSALRVRIFDEASKKYFVTTYSLHLPDGHWMYGKLRTGNGPDGFGPPLTRPPGNYEIEITNFMCGDKLWFFKDRILKPVVIQPGSPADVTIDVNLADAPARPSLENKAGAKCTVPPATQS